ncbi:MAG: Slp family lipoprotein [Thermodesulfovibrionales bacterium]
MPKKIKIFFFVIIISVLACAPVFRYEIMQKGIRDVSISEIRNKPNIYRGKLFILGGMIVNTKFVQEGSQIEALYIPVDSRGYLKNIEPGERFLAILPKDRGTLDPLIYRKEREVTIAGKFIELRSGKIDETEYVYPVFEIIDIYLWRERRDYYYPYYRPYWWEYPYPYYWWDPWWRPWGPYWRHPYWW